MSFVVFEPDTRTESIERLRDIAKHGDTDQLRYALEAVVEALDVVDGSEPIVFREQVVSYLLDKREEQ